MKNIKKYITIFAIVVVVVIMGFGMWGLLFGNRQIFDTHQRFDHAIVLLPSGEVITGPVDSWTDFEDGDQIQVTVRGVTYLVHSSNCALVDE